MDTKKVQQLKQLQLNTELLSMNISDSSSEDEEQQERESQKKQTTVNKATVLLANDEPFCLLMAENVLKTHFNVETAVNGKEALDKVME